MSDFDRQLKNAINIEPPEGLAERIQLNQKLFAQQESQQSSRRFFAMAASVFAVVGLSYALWSNQPVPGNPAIHEILAHVEHDTKILPVDHNVSTASMNVLLSQFGGQLTQKVGYVRAAKICKINNKLGLHFTMPGKSDVVTVFILPFENMNDVEELQHAGNHAIVSPAQKGIITVLAKDKAQSQEVLETVNRALEWKI